jgi:hypothetical protein
MYVPSDQLPHLNGGQVPALPMMSLEWQIGTLSPLGSWRQNRRILTAMSSYDPFREHRHGQCDLWLSDPVPSHSHLLGLLSLPVKLSTGYPQRVYRM